RLVSDCSLRCPALSPPPPPLLLLCPSFFFLLHAVLRDLHSFPTRRSSDLCSSLASVDYPLVCWHLSPCAAFAVDRDPWKGRLQEDRKSTRLNSSHVSISYAVFCLKKKKFLC